MVGMWAFTAMDLGLIPGWGANIPQATWCGKKKKKSMQHMFVLILYPATLLNLFICFNSFGWSSGFSINIYKILSSANSDCFVSAFQFGCLHVFFFLISLSRTSIPC